LAVLLLLPWAWGVRRSIAIKVSEHVRLERIGPILEQGDVPGRVSALVSLRVAPDRSVYSLSRLGTSDYRLQHFGPDQALLGYLDLPTARVGNLQALAILTDGALRLASVDGRLWALGADLKIGGLKPLKSPYNVVDDMECAAPGVLAVLDRGAGHVTLVSADGAESVSGDYKLSAGSGVNLARCQGGLALLEQGQTNHVRVLAPDLKPLSRFRLPVPEPAAPDRIGAAGDIILINDASGPRGVCFYGLDGRALGNAVGVGPDPITHSGFLAGDPAGGTAYLHYGAGLVKVRLPWETVE
jgi:hypothetical protein